MGRRVIVCPRNRCAGRRRTVGPSRDPRGGRTRDSTIPTTSRWMNPRTGAPVRGPLDDAVERRAERTSFAVPWATLRYRSSDSVSASRASCAAARPAPATQVGDRSSLLVERAAPDLDPAYYDGGPWRRRRCNRGRGSRSRRQCPMLTTAGRRGETNPRPLWPTTSSAVYPRTSIRASCRSSRRPGTSGRRRPWQGPGKQPEPLLALLEGGRAVCSASMPRHRRTGRTAAPASLPSSGPTDRADAHHRIVPAGRGTRASEVIPPRSAILGRATADRSSG